MGRLYKARKNRKGANTERGDDGKFRSTKNTDNGTATAKGRVTEQIARELGVNRDTVLNGHNRLRVLKAHPELKWHSTEIEFSDADEAKEWIIKTAIGTRNLTANQFQELLGRYQKMRKGRRGGTAPKGKGGKFQKSEKPSSGEVASATAQEFGVHRDTVYAAENFVDGLDAAEKVIPGVTDRVRSGDLPAQKAEVIGWCQERPHCMGEARHATIYCNRLLTTTTHSDILKITKTE